MAGYEGVDVAHAGRLADAGSAGTAVRFQVLTAVRECLLSPGQERNRQIYFGSRTRRLNEFISLARHQTRQPHATEVAQR